MAVGSAAELSKFVYNVVRVFTRDVVGSALLGNQPPLRQTPACGHGSDVNRMLRDIVGIWSILVPGLEICAHLSLHISPCNLVVATIEYRQHGRLVSSFPEGHGP